MSCTVIATRANDTGERNADEATSVPNMIRSVTAAAAVSVVNASPNHNPGNVHASRAHDDEQARCSYSRRGFDQETRIRDFYGAGDDKVAFRKQVAD